MPEYRESYTFYVPEYLPEYLPEPNLGDEFGRVYPDPTKEDMYLLLKRIEDYKKKYTSVQFRNSTGESYLVSHLIRYQSWNATLPFETVCGIKLKSNAYEGGRARYTHFDQPHEDCKACHLIRDRETEINAQWDIGKGE